MSVVYSDSEDVLYLNLYPFVVASVVAMFTEIVLLLTDDEDTVGAEGTVLSTIAGFNGFTMVCADMFDFS